MGDIPASYVSLPEGKFSMVNVELAHRLDEK